MVKAQKLKVAWQVGFPLIFWSELVELNNVVNFVGRRSADRTDPAVTLPDGVLNLSSQVTFSSWFLYYVFGTPITPRLRDV